MTTVTANANNAIDMTQAEFGASDEGVITATASTITIDYGGGYVEKFLGSFTYDGNGDLSGGTLTGYQEIENGVVLVSITGSVAAMTFLQWYEAGDVQAAFAYLLSGADTINGSNLNDRVFALGGADTLNGNGGDDIMFGDDGADTLNGGAGADLLNGGTGADTLNGGAGNDVYIVDNASDVTLGEASGGGTDRVESSVTWTLVTEFENLTLTGAGSINGTGNTLANQIVGNSGANTLSGLAGADYLNGAGGADTLHGGDGNDQLYGGLANDILFGGDGDDYLNGEAGGDIMEGGAGNDTYIVDHLGDDARNELEGGGAEDKVFASVDFTLKAHIEQLFMGVGAINGAGNDQDNYILGNDANNVISGMGGNDRLLGGLGNDYLDGGAGDDILEGGAGDDTYVLTDLGDWAVDLAPDVAGGGIDLAIVSFSAELGDTDGIEDLTLAGAADIDGYGSVIGNVLTGNSGSNLLDGGGGNDLLIGGAGNDILDGGDGFDILRGGLGDDIFILDDIGDEAYDEAPDVVGGGIDTAKVSFSAMLDANDGIENLTLTGEAAINGYGSDLGNQLRGNDAANILEGRGGDDLLVGGGGADYLDGGAGNDIMEGGLGDDIFILDDVGDAAYDEAPDVVGGGVDLTMVAFSAGLGEGDGIENLTLTGSGDIDGYGNELDNIITGNTGANLLDGGTGADTLIGGAGDDVMVVDNIGDTVVEASGQGNDLVRATITWTLGDNLEFLILEGAAVIDGTGNGLDNGIWGNGAANLLKGMDGADELDGDAGDDRLEGGAGNDTLTGGLGADDLVGGAGDDLYIVESILDGVTEAAGEGHDLVQSNVSWTLGANVEDLELVGGELVNGFGNELNNTILGNSASNTLSGGAGADQLFGGGSDDTLVGGDGVDLLDGGEGRDVVSYTLASSAIVANLSAQTVTVGGVAEDTLVSIEGVLAGSGNDTLTGNAQSNAFSAGAGDDLLTGGAGDDELAGDDGEDTVSFADRALSVTLTLSGGAGTAVVGKTEQDTLTGIENVTGSSVRDLITGDANANELLGGGGSDGLSGGGGNDLLDGGASSDAMAGGTGDDTYVVDHTADKVTEGSAAGTDTVLSSVTWVLGANLENLTLTGTAINGTGNSGNNTIIGNYRANTLIGGNGDDVLQGGDGADRMDGGAGADTMEGGLGNDTYIVSNTLDTLVELVGEGTDIIESRVAWTLADNFENLTLTGTSHVAGTGNSVANTILGNDGNNLLSGLGGNDRLEGNAGADTLVGGDGADILDGGSGLDVFTGGAGVDRFLFDEPDMAGLTAATADRITDFSGDRIALTDLDANTATVDIDDAFTFIGTGAFTGVAGQLRYEQIAGNTLITGDTNGDGVADFMIRLDGLHTLSAGHFFL